MALRSGRVGIHPSQVDPITGMLLGGTGGASIDDTSIASDTTWSSSKINTELSGKQDELTAGSNITIQNNVISSTASGGVLPLIKITAASGETVTLTKGQTVITATEVTSGNYEAEVPDFGTYVVSDGTNSDSVVVDTAKIYEVDITPGPSTISVTLTVHSATTDQLTIVDEDGTHLEQFASGQSSKSITVKIAAAGSSVSFTSSIAKDPSDLTEYYSKIVTVTSETTDIYVMPDNALYWYGYGLDNFTFPATVGTSIANILNDVQSGASITTNQNTNDIALAMNAPNKFACNGIICNNLIPNNSTIRIIRTLIDGNDRIQAFAKATAIVQGDEVDSSHGFTIKSIISGSALFDTFTNGFYFGVMINGGYNENVSTSQKISALWYE